MESLADTLPKQPKLEMNFLQACITRYRNFGKVILSFQPDALYEQQHQNGYHILIELYQQGYDCDETQYSNMALKLGLYDDIKPYLQELFQPLDHDPERYIPDLLDHYSRRREIMFADEIKAMAYNPTQARSNRHANLINGITAIAQTQSEKGSILSTSYSEYYHNLLEARRKLDPSTRMGYAWNGIDELGPTLQAGNMMIVAGDPGGGKTVLMEQQAEYWAMCGYRGVFYHLELSSDLMSDRRMCRMTGIPLKILQEIRASTPEIPGLDLTDRQQSQVDSARKLWDSYEGGVDLQHCPGWTMQDIVADLKHRTMVDELDFAVIDYFNKIYVPPQHNSYITYDIGQSIELLKSTLEIEGLVGMMAAQFPKGRAKHRTIGDVRDTGELEDKANLGIVIDREYDEVLGRRFETGLFRVTKFNAGREGQFAIRLNGSRLVFIEDTGIDF